VRMPGMSGLHLQDELKNRGILLPIIIVTGYAEVPTAVRALKTGAVDFIEKPFSDQLLVESVRHALALDQEARATESERAEATARLTLLSTREREVMERVTEGKPNKVIATELGIGEKTVEVHRANVMRKLCVDSVAALIRLVLLAQGPKGKPQ
jgi:two-component system, LuxR family, response regulator FixJ